MKKTLLFISILYIAIASSILNAEIKLNVSKPTIGIDDSFFLDFITQGNAQGRPDFSPLQTDFKVISHAQNHSTSVINGHVSIETRWHVVLRPKHEGQLTIPAITFGNDFSPPKTIEVVAAVANTPSRDDSIFLESELLPTGNIYEQSQFVYVIRLYRSVNLAQASLSELKTNDPDTLIEKLGSDQEREYIHPNGVRYLVLERKYAVSPQHAGELIFSPIVFEGEVIKSRNHFFHVETDFKRVVSKEMVVYVNPIPASFSKNNWLAANDVKLTEEWATEPNNMSVGEPITWTITLTAERCMAGHIPELTFDLPSSLKLYRDKTEINNHITPQGFTGVKKFKVALIATKSGDLTLPEITIPWWDMKTNKMKKTTLPSRNIYVKEGLIAMNSPSTETTISPTLLESIHQNPLDMSDTSTTIPNWVWALVAINVVVVLSFIGSKFQKGLKSILSKFSKTSSPKKIKRHLKKACYANDAKQAEIHLLAWYRSMHPVENSLNLMSVKNNVPPYLQDAILELNAALYGSNQLWDGRLLWKAIAGYKVKGCAASKNKDKEDLQTLYPS
ncbi:MAG: protein BatD [Parachlamydiaceae bacterium]|nr:protein BatD [Parachlamydiaceae bacterium]